jgi:hypothetical protein
VVHCYLWLISIKLHKRESSLFKFINLMSLLLFLGPDEESVQVPMHFVHAKIPEAFFMPHTFAP